jgi:uncharacterized membrane protein YeaQ/YmgE (transglycosylase-associated protein family)
MSKWKKGWMAIMVVGMVMLMVAPAFAKSISLKDAGIGLWIFAVIGAVIVLLQLIPAAILFFSFIGTTSAVVFKGKKREEEQTEMVPGLKPTAVKK